MEVPRPTFEVTPNLERINTFPYEGKGDRFAVDEVCDSPDRPTFADPLKSCYPVSGLRSLLNKSAR